MAFHDVYFTRPHLHLLSLCGVLQVPSAPNWSAGLHQPVRSTGNPPPAATETQVAQEGVAFGPAAKEAAGTTSAISFLFSSLRGGQAGAESELPAAWCTACKPGVEPGARDGRRVSTGRLNPRCTFTERASGVCLFCFCFCFFFCFCMNNQSLGFAAPPSDPHARGCFGENLPLPWAHRAPSRGRKSVFRQRTYSAWVFHLGPVSPPLVRTKRLTGVSLCPSTKYRQRKIKPSLSDCLLFQRIAA